MTRAQRLKPIVMVGVFFMMLSLFCTMAQADTLTITSKSGMSINAYQVAEIADNGAYKIQPEFGNINIENLSAKESEALAKKLIQKVGTPYATGYIDASGKVELNNLQRGVYLIQESAKVGDASRYTTFDPFLVVVSGNTSSKPKIEQKDSKDKTKDNEHIHKKKSVVKKTRTIKTEDVLWAGLWFCVGAGAAAVICLGINRRGQKRKIG